MSDTPSFQLQAKGKVVMVRPDGRFVQTGLAIRDEKLQFFDRANGVWVELPTLISGRGHRAFHIHVMRG